MNPSGDIIFYIYIYMVLASRVGHGQITEEGPVTGFASMRRG